MRRWKTIILLVGVLATGLQTIAAGDPVVPRSEAEDHIWHDGCDVEEAIERSGFVIDEPSVEAYLIGIVARLVATEGIDPEFFRVRVIRDTTLNAFALPQGVIYIHSGLIARMTNEAHLAAVLSHEITHVTHHHAHRGIRDQRTKSTMLAMVTASAGQYGGFVGALGELGATAAISGYSRSLEREADEVGWQRLLDAGYELEAAPEVFRMLMGDINQDARREPYFFGTHPMLKDREKNFSRMNSRNRDIAGSDLGAERFAAAILPILQINGELEMKAGRWISARDQLWRYRLGAPDDPAARWLIGELERRAGAEGNVEEATELLEEALVIDPDFAPAHRSLGLIAYKEQDWSAAAAHFQTFLDLDSHAIDRAYIEAYLLECENSLASPTS